MDARQYHRLLYGRWPFSSRAERWAYILRNWKDYRRSKAAAEQEERIATVTARMARESGQTKEDQDGR